MHDTESFEQSLEQAAPPAGLSRALRGLWHAGRGDWEAAHEEVQVDKGRECSWVHAWLHRQEGDLPNARYWYGRAGQTEGSGDLRSEWREIVARILAAG